MRTTIEVRAPLNEAEGSRSQVLRWLKRVGDRVASDEPLVEVETDKVTVEIPSPAAGVLREILKEAPQEIAPGDLLARLEPQTEIPAASLAPATPPAPAAALPGDAPAARLSPAVRRLLREHGVDPPSIAGTGGNGRITADDVERSARTSPRGAKAEPGAVTGEDGDDADVRRVVHSPTRRRIAEHMVESLLQTAPHVTTVFEADLGAVLEHRARHREEFARRGAPLTLTAYFLRACVDAIRAVPEANARWTADALELYRRVDIGVGTAVEGRGLVAPVLRRVETLDLAGIAAGLADLVRRTREDRLLPADVRGGTFTVSNHGVSGSLVAAPIVINQPQSAILGIGKVEKRVVVASGADGDAVAIRPRCYVTLTIDHRAMDGDRANRFLGTLVDRLEHWRD